MPETSGGAFSGAKREHLYKHIREGAKRQRMVRRLLAVYLVVLPIAIAVGSPQPAQASPAAVPANPPPTTPAVPIDWVAHLHGSETPAGGPGTTTFDASIADGPGSCASGFVSGSVICNVTSGAVSSGTLTGPFTDCNNITYTATEPALTGNNNFLDFLTSPVAGYPEGQVERSTSPPVNTRRTALMGRPLRIPWPSFRSLAPPTAPPLPSVRRRTLHPVRAVVTLAGPTRSPSRFPPPIQA